MIFENFKRSEEFTKGMGTMISCLAPRRDEKKKGGGRKLPPPPCPLLFNFCRSRLIQEFLWYNVRKMD